tara:strand:- start:19177 stop:20094 length:918 start_codon:yes stop_codon:yes gene_type:complete
MVRKAILAAFAALTLATPVAAETLSVETYRPARNESALGVHSLAVERFRGPEGSRFSFMLADTLQQVAIRGQPWFTVLVNERGDADAMLEGEVRPRISESRFRRKREVCWTEDENGECTEERKVEMDCIRLRVSVRPDLRLVARGGALLWTSPLEQHREESFCPEVDDYPDVRALVSRMLADLARDIRRELAPTGSFEPVRIMESRSGLTGESRDMFRDAVRLTKSDEVAACEMFERLHAANPEQPSLMFNVGLCAERRGDHREAQARYRAALASERSDDEASAGLRRIDDTAEAFSQIAFHFEQ